jgi:hypothetical protein
MGYRNEDGTWHDRCLEKVHPNEPIFVLRAQDKLAPALVRAWADLARLHGCPPSKVSEAHKTADAMEVWQVRKFPD